MNKHTANQKHNSAIRVIDLLFASVIAVILTPLWLINCVLGLIKSKKITSAFMMHDALDRPVKVSVFSAGFLRETLIIAAILQGRLQCVGVPLHCTIDDSLHDEFREIPSGLWGLHDLNRWLGLIDRSDQDVLREQQLAASAFSYLKMLIKISVGFLIYSGSRLHENRTFSVFGIKINNANLAEALKWMFSTRSLSSCEIGFFVNVNSINIALKNSQFKNTLQSANRVFADGSGIRLAASHTGERLRANLNGTDLLPHICRAAVEHNKSIYLLGSDVGIAEAAANNLRNKFVGLQVAGCHHGYFENSENEKIINEINESGAHICLVALGSPLQETWLLENAHKLNCSTALAVGGLLDFYSGKIPRAPSWLRELGFEWVWRLLQEPVRKFNRYVVGNPVFLIRTFILNQARG